MLPNTESTKLKFVGRSMDDMNKILNRLNGQIAASHLVATLAISVAAGNRDVARNLASSIGKLSAQLDPGNHEEFNRGFTESITKMKNVIADSTFEDGKAHLDVKGYKDGVV